MVAVTQQGKSLLAIGVTKVDGQFDAGAVIAVCDASGNQIAKGLTNYPSTEIVKIIGKPSDQIEAVLGHSPYESVIHRDNLAVE